ncbi:unnamed protein product [Prunus armeniaca]
MLSASRYRSYLAKWKGLLDSQASWRKNNPCLCPRTWSKHLRERTPEEIGWGRMSRWTAYLRF